MCIKFILIKSLEVNMYIKVILFSAFTLLLSNKHNIQDGIDFYNKRGDDNAYLVPSSDNINNFITCQFLI